METNTKTGALGAKATIPETTTLLESLNAAMADSDRLVAATYPGDDAQPQPVHSVYVSGRKNAHATPAIWGGMALEMLETVADPQVFSEITNVTPDIAEQIIPRVRTKLSSEPIEDLRIDFEDGFGTHADEIEDAAVDTAVQEFVNAMAEGRATRSWGIRFKSLEAATRARGVRTLVRFLAGVAGDGQLPPSCIVTLPKVTDISQVQAMTSVCEFAEESLGLASGTVRFEIQMETPQSMIDRDGRIAIPALLSAAQGRCTSLHYGAYDYTASCGIAAQYQSLDHPTSDFAKEIIQLASAGTGVKISDGAILRFPVGTDSEIRRGLQLHSRLVRRSLERGYYQGWDMHPGQLVTRFATTFAFYLEGFPLAAERIVAYTTDPATSTDEPASIRALVGFIRRALQCDAVTDAEVLLATGNTPEQLGTLL